MYELCQQALADGESVLERFGYSDDDAFAVGPDLRRRHRHPGDAGTACPIPPVRCSPPALAAAARGEAGGRRADRLRARKDCWAAPCSSGPTARTRAGSAATPSWTARSPPRRAPMLDAGRTGTAGRSASEGSRCGAPITLLVESSVPPPRMIVFGAIDFASALVRIGQVPRLPRDGVRRPPGLRHAPPASPRPTRSSSTGRTAIWTARPWTPARSCASSPTTPSSTYRCCELALRLPVAYVGAMGSRRTHLDRNERLREVGVTELELARLQVADRPGPRRPYARGDRAVHRGGDRRRPAWRERGFADGGAHADPPRRHLGVRTGGADRVGGLTGR